jgi:hypothetical protein
MYMLILYIISWVVAVGFGFIIANTKHKKAPVGTLRIDHSEPDEAPLLFLELSTDPRNIMHEKQVLLDVSTESYLSQK